MRLLSRIFLLSGLALASGIASAEASSDAHDLRVMTFNVRYGEADDGINAWPQRRNLMVRVIKQEHPDIMGTQELLSPQGDYLAQHLPDYTWFGMGRNGNEINKNSNEHMGVFYDKTRLDVLESGNFWLSQTPDKPGSIGAGLLMPRMVTWAKFRDRRSGKAFYYYDTHFPYRDGEEAEATRERCAEQIRQRLAQLPGSVPVVLTGDFNTTPDSRTHASLTEVLHDARTSAPRREGQEGTFHNFTGKADRRIDWILYRGMKAEAVRTITTHDGKVYPSDHFPVVADFSW
ncbi:endonuclease/exonuclease/phosphatase family protein [Frateuria hangzhouensis]|uniref:endonuclease/exonuclease/phosphatase family protein n=1 Tax=Frateuria hangzhouensis TaxID=2995589 RepID=UPI002260C850|nr:endonuclease/exonuclease/phosphatase family protein [Frateuria sp. STR12]MCX7514758.1 endonuclease/exonuclease/phosphatase family protein [Frateuria sp. STR12]